MIERADQGGVALVRMVHEPANVFATGFCDALAEELEHTARDADVRAVVLTGAGSSFSAGVDLFRLLEGGPDELTEFYASLHRLFTGLRGFPKALVAALNGHAIAGGFVLACGCDYRVMARGGGTLGAPELRVGVPFPGVAMDLIESAVPRRHLREVVLLGRIFDAESAVEKGLVDELVDADALVERAIAIGTDLGSIPAEPYALTKRQWAEAGSRHADSVLEPDVRALWEEAVTRDRIRAYLERTLGKSRRAE